MRLKVKILVLVSKHETDGKNLALVSKHETERKKFLISSRELEKASRTLPLNNV